MRRPSTTAAILLFLGASVADASEPTAEDLARIDEGYRSVYAWQIQDARTKASDALKNRPDDPLTWALLGLVKMHMSDYVGAVDLMRRAEQAGVPRQMLAELEAAEAARVATDGYAEATSEHFVLRHAPGRDEILVPHAVETLEASYRKIGDLLGWRPPGRVAMEFYPSAKTLARVSSLTPEDIENSGTIALCRWNRLMATTPRGVVFGYSWRDTIAHELTHLIIGGASKNTVPIWLHEGIAKYAETAWRAEPGLGLTVEQQENLRKAAKEDRLIPFAKMHPSMAKLPTQEQTSLAFSEVFTFIEFLVEKKGWAGIRAVLRSMADGESDSEAIAKEFGVPLAKLERQWRRSLLKRPIRRPAGPVKGGRKLVVKENSDAPDDALHGVSDQARRYARAADLLFSRGRLKAAQAELAKASEASNSPLISAKLAMVALGNGDHGTAERAARHAMTGAPNLAGPNVTLAEVLVRVGKPEDAEEPLERAIDINPFDPRIHQLTLAVLGEEGDDTRRTQAQRALALMTGGASGRDQKLGRGGLIEVVGPPFSRVFLRRSGAPRWLATGMVTPTSAITVAPGPYELVLLPVRGEVSTYAIEVRATPENGAVQTIIPGNPGS